MTNFVNNLEKEMNLTLTENGALTNKSSLNKNLDLYSTNLRFQNEKYIINLFNEAFQENKELAIKNFLNNADIRNGKGERKVTQVILENLISQGLINYDWEMFELLGNLSRYDILVKTAINTNNIILMKEIKAELIKQVKGEKQVTLLGKWMLSQSKNKDKQKLVDKFIKATNWNPTGYRKTLSQLRKMIDIVETKVVEERFEDIDYSKVPSKAMLKYRGTFFKKDGDNFNKFINSVNTIDESGKPQTKINSKVLYPYEIFDVLMKEYDYSFGLNEDDLNYFEKTFPFFQALWNNQRKIYIPENTNILPVLDFSGSMSGLPLKNSRALGLLLAHNNKGAFENIIIEFNSEANFIKLSGDLKQDAFKLMELNDVGDTNIDKVFENILNAMKNVEDKSEAPKYIVIVSDMQFNEATNGNKTNFESWKETFKENNLELPKIIFWEVSKWPTKPVVKETQNVAMISGFSNAVLDNLFKDDWSDFTPEGIMVSTLEKYQKEFEIISQKLVDKKCN